MGCDLYCKNGYLIIITIILSINYYVIKAVTFGEDPLIYIIIIIIIIILCNCLPQNISIWYSVNVLPT